MATESSLLEDTCHLVDVVCLLVRLTRRGVYAPLMTSTVFMPTDLAPRTSRKASFRKDHSARFHLELGKASFKEPLTGLRETILGRDYDSVVQAVDT